MTYLRKAIGLAVLILLCTINCGKKGPLILEPELLPQPVTNLQVSQVGQLIKLQWDFPTQLKGNSKDKNALQMGLEDIRQIYIYYSNTTIPGEKFRKKSDLLRKLSFAELTPVTSNTTTSSTSTKPQAKNNTSFFVTLPFQLKNLDNKQHFFAVQYDFRRDKAPLSEIATIATVIPIKAVAELTVNRENKRITLTWKRPDKDVAEKVATSISGYNVFKRIVADDPDESNESSESNTSAQSGDSNNSLPTNNVSKNEPAKKKLKETPFKTNTSESGNFIKINPDKILMEFFEDTDTGTNGKYFYYVTAIMTNNIESAPSTEVSIQVVDTFPPEAPPNLVCFKADDHMFLTWQMVADKDFSHFRVYRGFTPTDEFVLISDHVTSNQFKDKTVTKGKTYYYMVSAVDKKGNESELSNMAREQF